MAHEEASTVLIAAVKLTQSSGNILVSILW